MKNYVVIKYEDYTKDVVKEVKHFTYAAPIDVLYYIRDNHLQDRTYRIFKEVYMDIKEGDA